MAVAVADKENATDSGKKKKKRSWFWSSKDKEDGSFIEVNRRWGSKSKDKSDSADKPKGKDGYGIIKAIRERKIS